MCIFRNIWEEWKKRVKQDKNLCEGVKNSTRRVQHYNFHESKKTIKQAGRRFKGSRVLVVIYIGKRFANDNFDYVNFTVVLLSGKIVPVAQI